jgi:hypothetical protein
MRADHRTLAIWAADCAERTLHYFEEQAPEDGRPREAIEELREWVQTGVFRMAEVRKASLSAHAAARGMREYDPARSAARAAGHAMATAHVPSHAIAAAIYAATAILDDRARSVTEEAAVQERTWQYHHLLKLMKIA